MSSGAGPANLIFPSGVDSFSTKVDRNVVISGESQTIPLTPLYQFFLNYAPIQNSPTTTSIPGFVEVSGTPSTFQFQTAYSGINAGLITFNALQSGVSVNVTYKTFGDTIAAEFINSLQSGLTNVEAYVLANVASGNFVPTSGGTMTGPLVMQADIQLAGGNLTSQASGNNSVGSASIPMGDVFANNVTTYNVKSFSPLNILATGGDLTLSGNSVHVQSSTNVIDFQGNILPTTSGNKNIGSAPLAWGTAFIDKLGKNLVLVSGVNFLAEVSGSNTFGSALSPIGAIYADNIFSPSLIANLSGAFVHISGDTMTGNLNIASGSYLQSFILQNLAGDLTLISANNVVISGNAIPIASGTMDLGSPTNPWDTIYVKNIDGGVISGNFVLKTGDTMLGDLEFPVGTNLQVYSITSSPTSPSGDINLTANELNVDVTSNIRFSTFSNQKLEIGLSNIFTSTNIIPTTSGSVTLGDATRPFQAVYADNFYFLNHISGTVFTDVTFSGNITLASGTNLVPASGATVVIGSSGNPISIIYADTIFTTGSSGTFVSKFGDSMTGNLTMLSGAGIFVGQSGVSDIGSPSLPFDNVYADDVVSPGLDNRFVHKSGDTMTGSLVIISGAGLVTNSVSGNFLTLQGQQVNVTSTNGPIIINGNSEVQIDVNGIPKFISSPSGNIAYDSIVPEVSGAHTIGSILKPFGAVYADAFISNIGSSGLFVAKAGDTMTGNLTMASGANIFTTVSGVNDIGSSGTPFHAIYADNIITTSPSGAFVHITGDTMTGELAISNASFDVGGTNVIIPNLNGVGFGQTNIVSGTNAFAQGQSNQALASNSFAQGLGSIASALRAHAEGNGSVASAEAAHAEGNQTVASNTFAHSEGDVTVASGFAAHAEGFASSGTNAAAHAEGWNTLATGFASHTEGQTTVANGDQSHAEGLTTQALGTASHAEGEGSIAFSDKAHAEGSFTFAYGFGSHSEGADTFATGPKAHAEGSSSIASGNSSHAEGSTTIAYGDFAHAEGNASVASGIASHAEGQDSEADGLASHSEGNAFAVGDYSHAEGFGTITYKQGSHAEGNSAIASGNYSHAEGQTTKTFGLASHAEGLSTLASGANSHAEGQSTIAVGISAHAQGLSTLAFGDQSFAGGNLGRALGYSSVVLTGWSGTANASGSWIFADGTHITVNNNTANSLVMQFANGINLFSGTNILNLDSGINNLGSSPLPFNALFVNSINGIPVSGITNAGSGTFVHLIGDTMTGNLNMAGANITTSVSGANSIGALTVPFKDVYAKTGYFTNLSGLSPITFLSDVNMSSNGNISGDNLTITSLNSGKSITINPSSGTTINGNSGNVVINGGAQDVSIVGGAGNINVTGGGGTTQITGGSSALNLYGGNADGINVNGNGGKIKISGTQGIFFNATAGSLVSISGGSTGATSIELVVPASSAGDINVSQQGGGNIFISGTSTAGAKKVGIYAGQGTNNFIEIQGDMVPDISGSYSIGTPAKPFASIYANDIVDTSGTSQFVKRSGDTMTGTLNAPVVSGTLISGSAITTNTIVAVSSNSSSYSGTTINNDTLNGKVATFTTSVSSPTVSGTTINNDTLNGKTGLFSVTVNSPIVSGTTINNDTLNGKTSTFTVSVSSPILSGTTINNDTLNGKTGLFSVTVNAPIISGTTINNDTLNGKTATFANIVNSNVLSGTTISGVNATFANLTVTNPVTYTTVNANVVSGTTISGNTFSVGGNIIPQISGASNLGSTALAYSTEFVNSLKTNSITNLGAGDALIVAGAGASDSIKIGFGSNVVRIGNGSTTEVYVSGTVFQVGVDITPGISGTRSVGSASLPFSEVFTLAKEYVSAYDTTTQTVATANTFQDINFSNNAQINGWTHTASTATFTANLTGLYKVDYNVLTSKTTGANSTFEIRALVNGAEVAGSQSGFINNTNNAPTVVSNSFIISIASGQVLKLQMTASTNNSNILPVGANGTTRPSITMAVTRFI